MDAATVHIAFSATSTADITNGNGLVSVSGAYLYITGGGTYEFTGTATNMQIQVNTAAVVNLVFSGVTLTNTKNSPIYIVNADKANFILTEGTTNTLTDALAYTYEDVADEAPNAALCSKDDMTISGQGTLIVNGRFNSGIHCSNDLKILGTAASYPTLVVTAVNNGIKGKDSVEIQYADITVTTTSGDGIKSDTEDTVGKGYILIQDGIYTITSGRDGMQAYNALRINGGIMTIKTGKGSGYSVASTDTESYKGLKSDTDVVITGGDMSINSMDDGVHSNASIEISGGTLYISSGDDGIHGETTLTISGGAVNIVKSYEGVEALTVNFSGGSTRIVSSDDAVNAAADVGTPVLNISGGYLYCDATGDGLDSNGNIFITGGTTIVNGPTANNNGPLDFGDSGSYISQTGGTLIATGSSGMAVGPTTGSQYTILVKHSAAVTASSLYVITNSAGTPILAFKPTKTSYSICASTSTFSAGSYKLYSGGTYSGATSTLDGYYVGGTYAPGTQIATWTFSSTNVHATSGTSGGRP